MRAAFSFACGLVFAAGLCISGMTRPSKVLGFLDVTRHWDPSLAFVMVSAIAITAIAWRISARQTQTWLGDRPAGPAPTVVDARLVGGAALFGVGWGLGGFCPGPAVVALGTGATYPLVFVGFMLLGIAVHQHASGVAGTVDEATATPRA